MNLDCTINTSETELILRTYMVTPTSTGGPEIQITNIGQKKREDIVIQPDNNIILQTLSFYPDFTIWSNYYR